MAATSHAAPAASVPPAVAEPSIPGRSRVLIRVADGSKQGGDVASRIAAELDNVGFEVVRATDASRAGDAFATILLRTTKGRVEADIRLAHGAAAGNRHVDARDIELDGAQGAIAIRAVETLRATLFELTSDPAVASAIPEDVLSWARTESTPGASAPDAPASETPRANARSKALMAGHLEPTEFLIDQEPDKANSKTEQEVAAYVERIWVGGGLSVLGSSAALGLSFGPRVTFDYDLPLGFDIGASVAGVAPVHLVAANAYQILLLAEASYTIGKRSWVISPHVNLGLGAHIYETTVELKLASNTVPGLQRGLGFAAAPGVGAEIELAGPVRLDIDFATVFVLPEPMLACCHEGASAAGAKQPLFHASADVIFAP